MTTVYNKNGVAFNIDAIITDLNGKADVDLVNVNNSGTSRGAGWGAPSDTYTDLTLGARGTSYIAPADGYYCVDISTGVAGRFCRLTNQTAGLAIENQGVNAANGNPIYIPAHKGDTIIVDFDMTGQTNAFRFIYAVGSENEA